MSQDIIIVLTYISAFSIPLLMTVCDLAWTFLKWLHKLIDDISYKSLIHLHKYEDFHEGCELWCLCIHLYSSIV
jgi:hypothetical protein